MNKKFRLWVSVSFLFAGIISLVLYFTTAIPAAMAGSIRAFLDLIHENENNINLFLLSIFKYS